VVHPASSSGSIDFGSSQRFPSRPYASIGSSLFRVQKEKYLKWILFTIDILEGLG
jgi:hypothetical protein